MSFSGKAHEVAHELADLAKRAGMAVRFLANGMPVIVHRGSDVVVSVVAGQNGDRGATFFLRERLRAWGDGEIPLPEVTLILVPLLNEEGWDAAKPLWHGADPARAWHDSGKVPAVGEVMSILTRAQPAAHLELRESPELPCVLADEGAEFGTRLAKYVGVPCLPWRQADVEHSSESFVQSIGVKRAATFASSGEWSLAERFKLVALVFDFVVRVAARGTTLEALPAGACAVPLTQQEENYSCGAAALLAVLRYWSAFRGDEGDLYEPLEVSVREGTDLGAVCAVAKEHGLRSRCESGATLENLRDALAKGAPPIVALQAYVSGMPASLQRTGSAGHFVVLVAMDETRVFFMDPLAAENGYAWLPIQEFLDRWHSSDSTNVVLDHEVVFLEGDGPSRSDPPAGDLVKVESLDEYVNIDSTPYRNMRLQDTARFLAGAVRAHPLNTGLILKLIGRLVGGLESAVLGVDGRPEAERFARTLRSALSDLARGLGESLEVPAAPREYLTRAEVAEIFEVLQPIFSARA